MLSPFYEKWFAAFYPEAPEEPHLDCENCLMVDPPEDEPRRDEGPFEEDLKCCTYLPFTTNVALGSGELDDSSGWQVRWAIAKKRGVLTPLGLIPPESDSDREGFGQDPSRICPFYDQGLCTIWEQRSAVCANYVCMSQAGEAGLSFYAEAEELGNRLEWTLANAVLWKLGFTEEETAAMAEASRIGDREKAAETFGEWKGREAELFAKCYETAAAMETQELQQYLGEDEAFLAVSLYKQRSQL